VPGKLSRKNSKREGGAGATRARYRPSEKRSIDMNEHNATNPADEEATRRAEKEEEEAEKLAQKVEELNTKAEEAAYQREREERAKVREAQKTPRKVDERLEAVILILDAFESKEVLSYRVEAPAGIKPGVLWIAVKNGPPTIITIESENAVRVEKVGTDGRKVVHDPRISRLDDLTEQNVLKLIEKLASDWTDPEILPRLWDVLGSES
jgi:hypothetical protein